MAVSRPGNRARRGRSADSHWAGQYWVTVLLVVAFLAFAGVLIWKDNASTSAWQRLDSVFGVIGAITLTAVGWLFGREVHRGEAQAAKRDANQSKDRLDVATNRLVARTGDAIRLHTKLTTLATAVIEAPAPPDRRPTPSRTTTRATTRTPPARNVGSESVGVESVGVESAGTERVVVESAGPERAGFEGAGPEGEAGRAVVAVEPTSPPEDGLAMLRALAVALITNEPPPNRGGGARAGGPRGGGNVRRGGGGGNQRQAGGTQRQAGGNQGRARAAQDDGDPEGPNP
jgi:hypothetical protein